MSRYSLETHFCIYNDLKGTYLQIGMDGESGCCKIAWTNDRGHREFETFLADDEIPLVIQALQGYLATRAKP